MLVQPWSMEQGNMNVSWLKSKSAWLLYVLILFGTRFLIWLYMIDYPGWTIVNIVHAIVSRAKTRWRFTEMILLLCHFGRVRYYVAGDL